MKKTKVWTIYKHTLICDGPEKDWSYIGQTFKSVTSRWKNGTAYRDQPNFYTAIKKYGWDSFKHEILLTNISTSQEANKWERFYIKQFHTYTRDPYCMGWNATKGGTGIKSLKSADASKKVICIELDKIWDSAVDAAEELELGENGICMCCKGQRKTAYGFHWAYATDSVVINTLSQYKNKNKLPAQAKPVRCLETGKQYTCLNEAAKDTALKNGNSIGACCCGRRQTAGGYHWKYID